MIRLLALFVAVSAVGCADDPPPSATLDSDADRLLSAVTTDAVADAFPSTYSAQLVVTVYDGSEAVGQESVAIADRGDAVEIESRSATGTLADRDAETPRLRDPIATALPQDPPYLDPAVRDAYRREMLGDTTIAGTPFQIVEATLVDATRELGVRRVWAAVGSDGQIGAVEVERVADSAIYDETSRVRVDLRPGPDGWTARRVTTDTRTDVPFSDPAHVRTVWTVER